MTTGLPQHAGARAATAWTCCYTRGLADEVGAERRAEVAADLHDHTADALAARRSPGHVSRAVLARMLLGMPADLAWRRAQVRSTGRRGRPTDPSLAPTAGRPLWVTALTLGALVDVLGVALAAITGFHIQIWHDPAWWLHLVATVAATAGLLVLVRGRALGAVLLGVASLGMAVVWYWFIYAWLIALPLLLFFGYVAIRLPGPPAASAPRPSPRG